MRIAIDFVKSTSIAKVIEASEIFTDFNPWENVWCVSIECKLESYAYGTQTWYEEWQVNINQDGTIKQ
ncbi:MAG: hypothetical protein F6K24_13415 [Okeania sp. SIO2D1]|nr:hypothetical protein [Okeania sp. SIO2D1]